MFVLEAAFKGFCAALSCSSNPGAGQTLMEETEVWLGQLHALGNKELKTLARPLPGPSFLVSLCFAQAHTSCRLNQGSWTLDRYLRHRLHCSFTVTQISGLHKRRIKGEGETLPCSATAVFLESLGAPTSRQGSRNPGLSKEGGRGRHPGSSEEPKCKRYAGARASDDSPLNSARSPFPGSNADSCRICRSPLFPKQRA